MRCSRARPAAPIAHALYSASARSVPCLWPEKMSETSVKIIRELVDSPYVLLDTKLLEHNDYLPKKASMFESVQAYTEINLIFNPLLRRDSS